MFPIKTRMIYLNYIKILEVFLNELAKCEVANDRISKISSYSLNSDNLDEDNKNGIKFKLSKRSYTTHTKIDFNKSFESDKESRRL